MAGKNNFLLYVTQAIDSLPVKCQIAKQSLWRTATGGGKPKYFSHFLFAVSRGFFFWFSPPFYFPSVNDKFTLAALSSSWTSHLSISGERLTTAKRTGWDRHAVAGHLAKFWIFHFLCRSVISCGTMTPSAPALVHRLHRFSSLFYNLLMLTWTFLKCQATVAGLLFTHGWLSGADDDNDGSDDELLMGENPGDTVFSWTKYQQSQHVLSSD